MTPQEVRDELLRLTERYKMDEARRRVSMLDAARMNEAGNMPASPAMPTPLTEIDEPGNLAGRPSPEVGSRATQLISMAERYRPEHNNFVERVRQNYRPGPAGPQPPVPAILGRRG